MRCSVSWFLKRQKQDWGTLSGQADKNERTRHRASKPGYPCAACAHRRQLRARHDRDRVSYFEKVYRRSGKSENYSHIMTPCCKLPKQVDQIVKAAPAGQNLYLREFWSTRHDIDVRRIEPFFRVNPAAWEGGCRSASPRCKTSAGSFASGPGDGVILRCTLPVTKRAASAGVQ
jgi:hypothetical protein